MNHLVEFQVGEQYENRKGAYEVLEVQGDTMRIRWDNGEEIDTSVTMQSNIIERMQYERERLTQSEVVPPIRKSAVPNRVVKRSKGKRI